MDEQPTDQDLGTILGVWAHPDDETYLSAAPDGPRHPRRPPRDLRDRDPGRGGFLGRGTVAHGHDGEGPRRAS